MEGKGTKAGGSPEYFSLSDYPPGADIEYEVYWDGHRVVGKVSRSAHEKWLLKYQNAAGDPENNNNKDDNNINTDGESESETEDVPPSAAAAGGKRPCEEDHSNSVSATSSSSGEKALKRPCEDLVENPDGRKRRGVNPPNYAVAAAGFNGLIEIKCVPKSYDEIPPETVAAYAEVRAVDSLASGYAQYPTLLSYHLFPGRYGRFQEGDHIAYKLDKWAGPWEKPVNHSKVVPGECEPESPLDDDELQRLEQEYLELFPPTP